MQPTIGMSQYGYMAQAMLPTWDLGQLDQLVISTHSGIVPATVAVISSQYETAVFGLGGLLGPQGFILTNSTANMTAG